MMEKNVGQSGAVRIYPVNEAEEACRDYKCEINGRAVVCDTARVTPCPLTGVGRGISGKRNKRNS